jgi:hypothetical protein
MNDERDPLVGDALRRLAGAAPQPRPDRLDAVVEGVRRRRQVRTTTSALTAAAFVVAAAVGVHVWSTTASDSTVAPGPTLPAVSQSPDAVASSPPTSLSPVASASLPVIAPTPSAAKPTTTAKGLVATVTTPASVIDGDPAKVTMTVTNKGSVTTHGGSFTVVSAYAMAAGNETGFEYSGFTTSCQPVSGGLVCDVGTLKPGQSAQFWQAITATGPADQIVFGVKWTNNAGVSTTFHRTVQVRAGVPSSELPTPPSSGLPTPPSSSGPASSSSPTTSPRPSSS